MLFIAGLLTLLALASAGGDHVKGGGHVKGNPLASASVQQQVSQDEVVPSPYNFNIKTGAAYGTKIIREETGDAEGRVKGSYTIDGPRGTSRVVQYQADDSGFHANIKTSEPNIKTHSPANVKVEVSKKGASPIALVTQHQVPEKAHRTVELHHAAAVPVAQDPIIIPDGDLSGTRIKGVKSVAPSGSLKDKIRFAAVSKMKPTARPVVHQQKLVKTVESLAVKGCSPAQIKGASDTKSIVITQKEALPTLNLSPINTGAAGILPENVFGDGIIALNRDLIQKQGEAGFSRTFGGVLRTDGNLEGISLTSSDLKDLSKQIGFGSGRIAESPIREPERRKQDQVKPTVIRTSTQRITDTTRTRVIPGSVRVSGAPISSTQRENVRFVLGNDAGSLGSVKPSAQVISAPKPKAPIQVIQPQAQLGNGIIAINRELIQKQGEAGFSQTFGGVIQTDGKLDGVSLTSSEVQDLSKRLGYGVRGQPIEAPIPRKPDQVKPSVVRTSSQQVTGSTRTRVIPGSVRVPGGAIPAIHGENVHFVLGNNAGSVGVKPVAQAISPPKPKAPIQVIQSQAQLGDGIIAINRELIQKQGEAGFSQTFGGVIQTDGNLDGVSITSSELEDLSKRIGFGTRGQSIAAPVPRKPDQVKPTVVRTSSQQVTGSTGTRFIPGPVRISGGAISAPKPKAPIQVVQSQAQLGDGIIAINRELIQKQGEAGFSQTFGGVIQTDGNLDGVSITSSELEDLSKRIGFGTRGQPIAAPVPRKPDQVKPTVVRTSSQRITGSTGTRVIPGSVRVSGGGIPASQGENIRFVLGNDAGPAVVKPSGQVISAPKPKAPIQVVEPQVQLGDGIVAINRGLLKKQGEAGFSETFGGVIRTDGSLEGVSITSKEVGDLSRRIGQDVNKLVRAPLLRKPESVVNRNIVRQRVRVTEAPIILASKDISEDIVQLNRGLIDKQGAEGVLQTFSGLAKSEDDLSGIAVSLEDLKGLSRTLGTHASRTSAEIFESVVSEADRGQNIRGPVKITATGRQTSLNRGAGSMSSQTLNSPRQRSGPTAYSSVTGGSIALSEAAGLQQKINQDRIESQVIQETFDSSFPSVLPVRDIQSDQQIQLKVTPDFIVVDPASSQSAQRAVDEDDREQVQVKLDDITEQSSRFGQKVVSDIPAQSEVLLGDFNEKYLQEKLPVEIPGFIPAPSFLSPFNYRAPSLKSKIPTVQEQQQLEQVFV